MLNYIWAVLIFLGFISAVFYDSVDTATSKYRNGTPIQCVVSLDSNQSTEQKLEVLLDSTTLSKHFGTKISSNLKGISSSLLRY